MKKIIILFLAALSLSEARQIKFINKCSQPIWISPLTNNQGPMIPGGIVRLLTNANYVYQISDNGWAGRFWPKQGCNGNGQSCEVGQSIPPCNAGGCDPPAETKVEFFFPPMNQNREVYYDISLVDGYSLPVKIVPSVQQGGSCRTTDCHMRLDSCPRGENSVGDLRVMKNGRQTMCLSPCKKWNYPSPFGLGRNEQQYPGNYLCCPSPMTVGQCRSGPVVQTQYVKLVHRDCPSAYSYSYDDEGGHHNCPKGTSFEVTFCHV